MAARDDGGARADADPDLSATCSTIAHGSLMGARGNSGVILSQLLRGITDELGATSGTAGPVELARALARASDAGQQAVMRPVEGTILTVASGAASGAIAAAERESPSSMWLMLPVTPPLTRWLGPRSSYPCWRRQGWSTPVAPGTCSSSTHCSSWWTVDRFLLHPTFPTSSMTAVAAAAATQATTHGEEAGGR